MSTIDMKNVIPTTVRDRTIPMFIIPQGHVRFMGNKFNDGTFSWTICCSDKNVDVTKEHAHEEVWDNQTVEPVFAMHFESIEQIEACIKAFNNFLNRAKTI